MKNTKRFVWIDLEMTGLDPAKDHILEIATIITTTELEIVAEGPCYIIHQPKSVLDVMDKWVRKIHTASDLISKVETSPISLETAYQETLQFIKQHCKKDKAYLAGNSVWQDRMFLCRYMPDIVNFLNYRLIDVSSLKLLVKNWYAKNKNANFKKDDSHRALNDIRESINELKHYRQYFFVKK